MCVIIKVKEVVMQERKKCFCVEALLLVLEYMAPLSCSEKISYLWHVEFDSINYPIHVPTAIRYLYIYIGI